METNTILLLLILLGLIGMFMFSPKEPRRRRWTVNSAMRNLKDLVMPPAPEPVAPVISPKDDDLNLRRELSAARQEKELKEKELREKLERELKDKQQRLLDLQQQAEIEKLKRQVELDRYNQEKLKASLIVPYPLYGVPPMYDYPYAYGSGGSYHHHDGKKKKK